MPNGEEVARPPWRGWHVIGRFFPMVLLGVIFVVIGVAVPALHRGHAYGVLFLWIGAILIVAAVLGMIFTKCPHCYQTRWVVCMQEPDVVRESDADGYYRELSRPEDEG